VVDGEENRGEVMNKATREKMIENFAQQIVEEAQENLADMLNENDIGDVEDVMEIATDVMALVVRKLTKG
jgi:hypothetical protein